MFSLLVVEDDAAIREMLTTYLLSKNYEVMSAENGNQALDILHKNTIDLLLLDWMLPDTEGVALIPKVRDMPVHKELPVLMLTAKTEESDKIQGLDVGADDYMTKPVSLKELAARIRALIRRSQGLNPQQLLVQGDISCDPENKTVQIKGETIKISSMEYRLLYFFLKNPNRLFSRSQLLDNVWGQTVFVEERTVDVHILRLRKILKKYDLDAMLKTIRGSGYRFVVEG